MYTLLWWMFACSETEKTDADTDQDGFTDAEEAAAGTNPNDAYSRPYEQGNYNIGYCANGVDPTDGPSVQTAIMEGDQEIAWSHYKVGDVVANVQLQDQYGQNVDLYSFCGNHIMLVVASFI